MNLSSFRINAKNVSKDAVWYSPVICAALAEATNISVVYENEKNFKKLLVKNKAKLINSLLAGVVPGKHRKQYWC